MALLAGMAILVMWGVLEYKGTNYITSNGYVGSGFFGYLAFSGKGLLAVLLLVLCLAGGIRLLLGKPFLFAFLRPSAWVEWLLRAGEECGFYSERTRRILRGEEETERQEDAEQEERFKK